MSNPSKWAMQLTPVALAALPKFDPGVTYGPTLPRGISHQVKPRLAQLGLLDRGALESGSATYRLSAAGEQVRRELQSERTGA